MAACIDDKPKRIAEAFQCDAAKLLGHILVFQIELENIGNTNIIPADKEIMDIYSKRKISKAVRDFEKYMWMTELLEIMNAEPNARQGRLNEMMTEIENQIDKL